MGQPTRTTTPATTRSTPRSTTPEPLWRELTGRVLRRHRHERGERLAETAERAGVSTQYLSEVERGRKDPSSEILAAVAGALDLTLLDLAAEVARDLRHLRHLHHLAGPGAPGARPLAVPAPAVPAPAVPAPAGPAPLPIGRGTSPTRACAPLALVA